MLRIPTALSLTFLCALGGVPSARAQKTESGLLAAWEEEQKSDPATIKFEKTQDRQYHFSTKRFPFDGILVVRNVLIEDDTPVNQYGVNTGTLEVELQGAREEFFRTYSRSYSQWNLTNILYWEPQPQRWLTSEQYFQQVRSRLPMRAFWPALVGFGWTGFLVLLLGLLVLSIVRYNSKIKVINQRSERTLQISERNSQLAERNAQIFEKSLKLHEQNLTVFEEILDQLKKLNTRQ